jgi:alanyl-tRNA synthetase
MAVKKVFWENPYQTELITKVNSAQGNIITLFETIAFAFSGGQQSDDGEINGFKIINARKVDKEIYYTIESAHDLFTGDEVLVKIDWNKRYKLMKLHFAAEIILELINQNFSSPEKFGANISVNKARLDFIWNQNISEIFSIIEPKAKAIIDSNLPIISAYRDFENEIRYWEIEGFGKVECSGTHIKSTGEIGTIRLKRITQGNNKERIEIYLIQ